MWVLSSFSFFLSLPPHLTTCKIWSVKKNRSSFMPLTHACHPQDSSLSYILHGLRESSVFDLHLGTSFCKPRCAAFLVDLQYTLGGSRSGNHSQMFNWNVFLIESMKRMYTWKVPGGGLISGTGSVLKAPSSPRPWPLLFSLGGAHFHSCDIP